MPAFVAANMQTLKTKPLPSRRRGGGRLAWIALVAIGALGAGCYPKGAAAPGALSPGGVAWAAKRWPGVDAAALTAGHDRFIAKCNGCHDYPDLVAVSEEHWPGIVESMAKKAHLGPDERDGVLHYVLAARSEQAGH